MLKIHNPEVESSSLSITTINSFQINNLRSLVTLVIQSQKSVINYLVKYLKFLLHKIQSKVKLKYIKI